MQVSTRRSYEITPNEKRLELIALMKSRISIKKASIITGIKYENAKAIYRTYRLQDRSIKIGKLSDRIPPKQPALVTHMPEGSESQLLGSSDLAKPSPQQNEKILSMTEPNAKENFSITSREHSFLPKIRSLEGYQEYMQRSKNARAKQIRRDVYLQQFSDLIRSLKDEFEILSPDRILAKETVALEQDFYQMIANEPE